MTIFLGAVFGALAMAWLHNRRMARIMEQVKRIESLLNIDSKEKS